jgi:hypothetical protein
MLPDPLELSPMLVFVFVQLNVSPPPVFAAKIPGSISSVGHTSMSLTSDITGVGFIVIEKLRSEAGQELS